MLRHARDIDAIIHSLAWLDRLHIIHQMVAASFEYRRNLPNWRVRHTAAGYGFPDRSASTRYLSRPPQYTSKQSKKRQRTTITLHEMQYNLQPARSPEYEDLPGYYPRRTTECSGEVTSTTYERSRVSILLDTETHCICSWERSRSLPISPTRCAPNSSSMYKSRAESSRVEKLIVEYRWYLEIWKWFGNGPRWL